MLVVCIMCLILTVSYCFTLPFPQFLPTGLIIVTQENLKETTEAFLEATDEVQETTDDGYIAFGDIAEATDVKKAGSSEAKTKDNEPKMCPMFWSGPTEEEEDVDMGCWGRGVSCLPGKKGCRGIQNAFIFLGYNIIKLS